METTLEKQMDNMLASIQEVAPAKPGDLVVWNDDLTLRAMVVEGYSLNSDGWAYNLAPALVYDDEGGYEPKDYTEAWPSHVHLTLAAAKEAVREIVGEAELTPA